MASCACSGTSDGSVWHAMASEMESEGGVCELGPGTRPACPGRAQETTKLSTTGRCMHADADAAAAGRTSAAQVGRGANTEINSAAARRSLPIPIYPTALHTQALLTPDETVELAPVTSLSQARHASAHVHLDRSKRPPLERKWTDRSAQRFCNCTCVYVLCTSR